MPDYLSRSPVGGVEEDPDEIPFLISKLHKLMTQMTIAIHLLLQLLKRVL